ncbi:hypothetical protein FCIRC_12629 [Fusarium circinatum]|uniref:F-box domain-containing protein n=1 Tax=Fusarium circinatum TaxID=48490 RepID=A0A8H5SXS2_FUSCI|nr:hypothetical protein FCIRC_12629 [Fusarium circinatum]
MNLQNLPPELISLICEALCPHCPIGGPDALALEIEVSEFCVRRDTLLSLCLLCKSWADIAQRILFHTQLVGRERTQIRFCRSICERPELGRSVRWTTLKQISQLDWDLEKDDDSWLFKSLERFSEILNIPPAPYNFSTGAWSPFIVPLILLQIPNAIFLHVHTQGVEHLMQQFRKPHSSHLHAFPQNVVRVIMREGPNSQDARPQTGPIDLSDTAGGGLLSNIPSVEILSLGNPVRQTIKSPLKLHNIRDLQLRDVCLGREELRLLVSATGPLEAFEYMGRTTDEPNQATGQDVCEVLMMKKDTLTEATVATYYHARHFTAARSLENLTWLRIPAQSIWQSTENELALHDQAWVAVFPPNLSTIVIDIWLEEIEGLFDAFTTYILSQCPDRLEDQVLKYVRINIRLGPLPEGVPNSPSPSDYPNCEKIKQKCCKFLERGDIVIKYYYGGEY